MYDSTGYFHYAAKAGYSICTFKQAAQIGGALVMLGLSVSQIHAGCFTDVQETTPTVYFVDNNDGTVTDDRSGLMWSVCSEGQSWNSGSCQGSAGAFTWDSALATATTRNSESYLGYDDWRLPNKKELVSIVEYSCLNPAINLTVFPSTPNTTFWSSTPEFENNSKSWRLVMNFGNSTLGFRNETWAVRLVRN